MSKKLEITISKKDILGDVSPILTGYSVSKKFIGGKPSDENDGYRVDITAPGAGMAAYTVKVPEGGIDLGSLTQEDINRLNGEGAFVRVGFAEDFSARPYVDRGGNLALVCTASRVFLVDTTGKAKSAVTVKEV